MTIIKLKANRKIKRRVAKPKPVKAWGILKGDGKLLPVAAGSRDVTESWVDDLDDRLIRVEISEVKK